MVALRKQHKLLLQHIRSQGSRLDPLKPKHPSASPPLREDESSPPLLRRLCGLFQPMSDVWLGILGGQSLLEPHHCAAPPSSITCCPNKSLSVPFDPILLHKNSMQFYGVHRLPCCFFFFFFYSFAGIE